ncbi:MAG: Bax protein [Pseudohongiellaceae bacterium]|jgi:Bax protein
MAANRRIELLVIVASSVVMAVLIITVMAVAPQQAPKRVVLPEIDPIAVFPDFASIADVDEKKRQFFDYLENYVDSENQKILQLRADLEPLAEMAEIGVPFSAVEKSIILELAESYRLEIDQLNEAELVLELMRRVDVIPPSLVLAQAANESAWGTSRFTLEGNNVFGQWCFIEGCGIVPKRRSSGAIHEVKSFDSVASAVSAYFLNINTNQSYDYLRDLRVHMRNEDQPIDSMVLAIGLGRYSQRGDHYVDEVQNIILQNDLHLRDEDLSV